MQTAKVGTNLRWQTQDKIGGKSHLQSPVQGSARVRWDIDLHISKLDVSRHIVYFQWADHL